ncbi:MAG: hypothetical protein DDT19_02615 [Syntrophomonadaceae bacterium]|nr:hypothetical protein [Bacillota bacterium]
MGISYLQLTFLAGEPIGTTTPYELTLELNHAPKESDQKVVPRVRSRIINSILVTLLEISDAVPDIVAKVAGIDAFLSKFSLRSFAPGLTMPVSGPTSSILKVRVEKTAEN